MIAHQFDFFAEDDDDPADESLADITVGSKALNSSVVYNADWTVETIILQLQKNAIDLSPSFQRRDAWPLPKKSLLIESIALNFPIPPLTLAEIGNSKSYIVVDGKQRLTTLAQFFGLMPLSKNNSFKLKGLKETEFLNDMDFDQLRISNPDVARALENYTIRTNVIRGWKSDDVLYSIFHRLNSGSVKLSPQELRQALNPGEFSEWVPTYTEHSPALRKLFPGTEPDFRMRDVELMVRYLGMQLFLPNYRGDLKRFLDGTAKTLNKEWNSIGATIQNYADKFEKSVECIIQAFGKDHAFRKWNGDKWENKLNRAVFDIMTFFIDDEKARNTFVEKGDELKNAYITLCTDDRDFRETLETTTKSIKAVAYRLEKWGAVLNELGVTKKCVRYTSSDQWEIIGGAD